MACGFSLFGESPTERTEEGVAKQIVVQENQPAVDTADGTEFQGVALLSQLGFHGAELVVCLPHSLELAEVALQEEFEGCHSVKHQPEIYHTALAVGR
jgi:hypothetical protein